MWCRVSANLATKKEPGHTIACRSVSRLLGWWPNSAGTRDSSSCPLPALYAQDSRTWAKRQPRSCHARGNLLMINFPAFLSCDLDKSVKILLHINAAEPGNLPSASNVHLHGSILGEGTCGKGMLFK